MPFDPNKLEEIRTTPTGLKKIEEDGISIPNPRAGLKALGVTIAGAIKEPAALLPGYAGTQKIIENIPEASIRGAEAMRPGFQPETPQERIGSAIGSASFDIPLALSIGGPTNISLPWQMIRGGLAMGTVDAIKQATDKGDIDIPSVGFSSVTGAAFPVIVPTLKSFGRIFPAITKRIVVSKTNIPEEAVEAVQKEPSLIKSYRHFRGKLENLQSKISDSLKNVGDKLDAERAKFGIGKNFDDEIDDIANGRIQQETKDTIEKSMAKEYGEVISGKAKNPQTGTIQNIPTDEIISRAYKLRKIVDGFIRWRKTATDFPPIKTQDEAFYSTMRSNVNKMLDNIKEAKDLRNLDEQYSIQRNIYDSLQKNLSTEGKAAQTMIKLSKGETPDELAGILRDQAKTIQKLEKETGEEFLEPLKKSIYSFKFRHIKGRSPITGSILEGMGGLRTGMLVSGGKKIGEISSSIGEAIRVIDPRRFYK